MPKSTMTDEHKAALAKARQQGKAVRDYLEALTAMPAASNRPDPDKLAAKITDLQGRIEGETDPLTRVQLIQQRLDLEVQAAAVDDTPDMDALEAAFIQAAAGYAARKNIAWPAWREIGVPAAVLKKAGIRRTRRRAV